MPNAYGNYVIQWILQKGAQQDRDRVIEAVKGRVVVWSRHKFASNVVEQVVRTAGQTQRRALAEEILVPPHQHQQQQREEDGEEGPGVAGGEPPAVSMAEDPFANFVLQRFLEACDGDQKLRLVAVLQPRLAALRKRAIGGGGGGGAPPNGGMVGAGAGAGAGAGWTKHLAAVQMKCDAIRPQGMMR